MEKLGMKQNNKLGLYSEKDVLELTKKEESGKITILQIEETSNCMFLVNYRSFENEED